MTRFFVTPAQIAGRTATLDEGDAYHLRVVLKAAPGDPVSVLDGTGRAWHGKLDTLGKTRATVTMGEMFTPQTEPSVSVTVAQALPKMADKMETVLQHGTEIGAVALWAFQSARSLTHLTGERHEKRLGRWAAIVKTAAEQAGRARLPHVRADGDLDAVLAAASGYDVTLLAHPDAPVSLKDVLQTTIEAHMFLLIVGPESGFTGQEVGKAQKAGAQVVSLGPRTLRTETAAFVVLSQILFARGN